MKFKTLAVLTSTILAFLVEAIGSLQGLSTKVRVSILALLFAVILALAIWQLIDEEKEKRVREIEVENQRAANQQRLDEVSRQAARHAALQERATSEALDGALSQLGRKWVTGGAWRISLYELSSGDLAGWHRLARSSSNMTLETGGRAVISRDSGVLGLFLREAFGSLTDGTPATMATTGLLENDAPEPQDWGTGTLAYYRNMNTEELRALRMRPDHLFGVACRRDGSHGDTVALIVELGSGAVFRAGTDPDVSTVLLMALHSAARSNALTRDAISAVAHATEVLKESPLPQRTSSTAPVGAAA